MKCEKLTVLNIKNSTNHTEINTKIIIGYVLLKIDKYFP